MVTQRRGSFLYVEQWDKVVRRCLESLEQDDIRQIKEVDSLQKLQAELDRLQEGPYCMPELEALALLTPSLSHLRTISLTFVESSGFRIDITILWGMLHLIIQLSAQVESGAPRLSRILKVIGHRVELFNNYCKNAPAMEQIPEATFDAHVVLIGFYTKIIKFFRDSPSNGSHQPYWNPLLAIFEVTLKEIDETFQRIEKLAQIAKEFTHVDEISRMQNFLSITPEHFKDQAKLPCVILPPSGFALSRSFNRQPVLNSIKAHFKDGRQRFCSVALYGLGGVGKSHIAIKYAYTNIESYDAILWVFGETRAAIEQSFTDIAIRLQLPNATPGNHTENKIQVLTWLQQTTCRWLLIFDNVEDSNLLLSYWPIVSRGHALITTRNHSLAFEPADIGLEILAFENDEGSKLLLHLLSLDITNDLNAREAKSALDLAEKLSGHALAISQMASLIHQRSWSIEQFVPIYMKSTQKLHQTALAAVWKLSFESLDPMSSALLGVLSYIAPDSVPQTLFETSDASRLPTSMQFCNDEFNFSEVLQKLLTLALVKRDKDTREFSMHRLVQSQYRYFVPAEVRQQAFWDAASLLLEVFPHSGGRLGQLYAQWAQCGLYLQHVLILAKHYKEQRAGVEGLRPNQAFCWLLAYCSRYLIETVNLGELAEMTKLAIDAYASLNKDSQDLYLHGLILNQYAFFWYLKGDYDLAEKHFKGAYDLHVQIDPPDHRAVAWRSYNMGLVTCSSGRLGEAVNWYSAAYDFWQNSGDDTKSCMGCLKMQLGQAYFYQRRFREAQACYDFAVEQLKGCNEWGWVAFTYLAQGNLHRELYQLEAAESKYKDAQAAWTANDQTKMHNFYAACLFKLGCVALDRGDYEAARSQLETARIVAKLQEHTIPADYKRIMNKIFEVYQHFPQDQSSLVGTAGAPSYSQHTLDDVDNKTPKERELFLDSHVHVNWR